MLEALGNLLIRLRIVKDVEKNPKDDRLSFYEDIRDRVDRGGKN